MKRWHFVVVLLAVSLGIFGLQNQREEQRNPANLDNVPILGFFTQGAKALMSDIYGIGNKVLVDGRDTAVFLVGGVAIDVYIRTQIPLRKDVEKRIISRLHDYEYASRLTYFLMGIKNRYTLDTNIKNFETYIKENYKSDEEVGLIHSLFSWKKDEKEEKEDSGLDMKLVAKLVTLYDAIFAGEMSFIDGDKKPRKVVYKRRNGRKVRVTVREKKKAIALPEKYTRLGKSAADQAVMKTVIPMVVELLAEFSADMEAGDMKDMVNHIISDGAPEKLNVKNNKAVAATASLVDFVRLTVLKNYRIYVKRSKRIASHEKWMKDLLSEEYSAKTDSKLIAYLKYANSDKKFGVQYVVDGLQGNLLEALALGKKDYLRKLVEMEYGKEKYKPKGLKVGTPEHVVQFDFLKKLIKDDFYTDERYLPFFKNLYRNSKNTVFKNGISTTPTISVRNLPIAKTGAEVAGPGGTSIPNFHFVDRKKDRAYYFFGNDALLLEELADEQGMKSMFDRLGSYKTLNCNAQYDWAADYSYEPLINLGLGETTRDFGETLCVQDLKRRAKNEVAIRVLRLDLIDKINNIKSMGMIRRTLALTQKSVIKNLIAKISELEEDTLPDYLLAYIPWPDHFAHFKGAFSDEIISPTGELNRLDYWLTSIQDIYKSADVYKRSIFAMAGDHGLSPIYYFLNPEVVVLEELQKDLNRKFNVLKISSDEGEGPKLTNALDPPTNKGIDIVVASTAGGNYMMDFFNGQGPEWVKQPNYQDLVSWQALDGGAKINIIEETVNRLKGALEYLVVREHSGNSKLFSTRLIGHNNGKRVDEVITRYENRLMYKAIGHKLTDFSLLLINKTNPLISDYSSEDLNQRNELIKKCVEEVDEGHINSWCTIEEWRQLASTTSKPDSIVQLGYLYASDRAGTVNLFPRDGIGFNTIVPGRHAGESFFEKDAFVGFWGGNIKSDSRLKSGVNGSIAPTVFEYLTGQPAIKGNDGWGFSSHLSKITK